MMSIKKAPKGKFRVIGKDDAADVGWTKGDYPTLSEATDQANSPRFRVYNDIGECVWEKSSYSS